MVNGKKKKKKKTKRKKRKNGLSTTIEEVSIIEDHPDTYIKIDTQPPKAPIVEE